MILDKTRVQLWFKTVPLIYTCENVSWFIRRVAEHGGHTELRN